MNLKPIVLHHEDNDKNDNDDNNEEDDNKEDDNVNDNNNNIFKFLSIVT